VGRLWHTLGAIQRLRVFAARCARLREISARRRATAFHRAQPARQLGGGRASRSGRRGRGTGIAVYLEAGGKALEEVHELAANAALALVVLHIVAAIASSFLHRENLVRAMLTGYKQGEPGEAAAGARPLVALLLVGVVVAFWSGPSRRLECARIPASSRRSPSPMSTRSACAGTSGASEGAARVDAACAGSNRARAAALTWPLEEGHG
jgi:hypothetical protein